MLSRHFHQVISPDSLGPGHGLEPIAINMAQSVVCLAPAPCQTGPSSKLPSALVLCRLALSWVAFLLLSVWGPLAELLGTIHHWGPHPSILRACPTLAFPQGVLLASRLRGKVGRRLEGPYFAEKEPEALAEN